MLRDLFQRLRSEDKLQIQEGLEALAPRLRHLDGPEFEEALQAVIGVFYADPLDHPELLPALDQAEELLADLRGRAIPVILRSLGESDLKTHFRLASALGRMGYEAVEPLVAAYAEPAEDYVRVFVLYALGKVRDPATLRALPLLFRALDDPNAEVRDTAARTLGKIVEQAPPGLLPEAERRECHDRLLARASDPFAGVRSKALRSLGKMARHGHLSEEERRGLRQRLAAVLGEGETGTWDVAYVVRAEAQKARAYV